jgi:hypothetical protein
MKTLRSAADSDAWWIWSEIGGKPLMQKSWGWLLPQSGQTTKTRLGVVEAVVVQSEPVGEPEAENETSQEVFLKCLGLGGKWIQVGDSRRRRCILQQL